MRIATLIDLRKSKVYQQLASLQGMPGFRQQRFIEVFNKIFDLATGRGAKPDVAEANASALAILAAERYTPTPKTASLEDEEHYFATMTEFQYSNGGQIEINDFTWVLANLDVVNAAVAGNAFNLDHEHTEPTGVIRRLERPEDVPAEVRAKYPDAPYFTVASFYEDTPEAIRAIETVSAEWMQSKVAADGSRKVVLPDSFALTKEPATPPVLGVGKAAGLGGDAKGYEAKDTVEGTRDTMPATIEELQAKVAGLQKELDASKESGTTLADLKTKHASLEKEHKDFVAKVAGLTGTDADEDVEEDVVLTGLSTKMSTLEADVKALKQDALTKEANAWADEVVKTKNVPATAKSVYANLFLADKKQAEAVKASLADKPLTPKGEQSLGAGTEVDEEKQAALLSAIDPKRFKKPAKVA